MNSSAIIHEFDGNVCKLIISPSERVQIVENCDIFVDEYNFIFIADVVVWRFQCPRKFDIKDMKNIPIAFDTERWEYTCRLPCYPEESKAECIEKGELDKNGSRIGDATGLDLRILSRITDSCVLTVDNEVCDIIADFGYGFAGRLKGKPTNEEELALICRITSPHLISPVGRTIQREKDETKDFCGDQYKLNFVELQIPDGHDNPMKYTISYEDNQLSADEEYTLHNITSKDFVIKLDADQIKIDCGLVSILLAICYDIRTTSNDLTCESAWTRTVLSSTFSYFEVFENLTSVVDSFLRRSLIYPLYRNYDLGRLCVEDVVQALQKSKAWIIKQLVATYNCFIRSECNRSALNVFFLRDYIKYVAQVLDVDHLHMLSRNLKNVLLDTSKRQLRLGLAEIETELLKELIEDIHLRSSIESDDDEESDIGRCSSSEGESVTDSDDSYDGDSISVIERKL